MKKVNFYLDKISLFLIILLPIGLLISSGVSEIIVILMTIIFLITSTYNKDFYWLKNKYFLLLLIIWISLLLNLLFSENFFLSFPRNIFFFKNILFVFAIISILNNKIGGRRTNTKIYSDADDFVENHPTIINYNNTDKNGSVLTMPNTMELHYGNVCNLKCRMCSQNYSNQIGKELLEIGNSDPEFLQWVIKQSGNVNNWTNNLSVEYKWFENGKNKKKLNDFINKNISQLTVIGGEPTIIPEFYELFEHCDKNGTLGKKQFSRNNNIYCI
jgi:hypothetical protein